MPDSLSAEDPYALLGISADADDEQIRHAYRRLALRHHPDHNGGSPQAAQRFAKIQAAYAEALRRRAAALSPAAIEERRRLAERLAALEAEVRNARAEARGARRMRMPRPLRRGGQGQPLNEPVVSEVNSLIEGLGRLASMLDGRDR